MKILIEGKLPTDTTHICTCRKCKTMFEFATHEAKFVPGGHDDRDCLQINCPFCGDLCEKEL